MLSRTLWCFSWETGQAYFSMSQIKESQPNRPTISHFRKKRQINHTNKVIKLAWNKSVSSLGLVRELRSLRPQLPRHRRKYKRALTFQSWEQSASNYRSFLHTSEQNIEGTTWHTLSLFWSYWVLNPAPTASQNGTNNTVRIWQE
jgi:hypothetical protein